MNGGYVMEFKDFVNSVKTGTKDTVEIGKLKAKIAKEKSDIREAYDKIGEMVYKRYKELGIADEEILGYIGEIDSARDRISGYNKDIDNVKMR